MCRLRFRRTSVSTFARAQIVFAAAKKSNLQNIHTGLPKGSVLGPILFLIYINELPQEFSEIQKTLFADDTSVLQNYNTYTEILITNHNLKKN